MRVATTLQNSSEDQRTRGVVGRRERRGDGRAARCGTVRTLGGTAGGDAAELLARPAYRLQVDQSGYARRVKGGRHGAAADAASPAQCKTGVTGRLTHFG